MGANKITWQFLYVIKGLSQWLGGKEAAYIVGAAEDEGLIPGWGRSPGGRHGNPLQHSCLENTMDRSWTRLK